MTRIRVMKNNPAFLTQEELIRGFVVRHADLELVLERLREERGPASQHALVIAPRGMGKTTLVLRVAAEVRRDAKLSKEWFPIVFGEESYEVATAAELWLQALDHLGQQTGDERWKQAYLTLRTDMDDKRVYERALGRLMDFADEQGKRLLVIVENLNMILSEQMAPDDGWTLRHTLQNEPRIMLLATATSRFEEIDNVRLPMYDLFWTFDLRPLNTDECRIVWHAITGHELLGKRIRPVEILTGGSPRLLSILASFAAEMSVRQLMGNLAHLVDEHTSYFKSNLDALPAGERKVYVTLAELWSPATAKEVGAAARMDVSKTSANLARLKQKGAVEEVKRDGRVTYYQVSERLYNIYHLMRKRGGGASRVRAIVEFMAGYYESEEIVPVLGKISAEACGLDRETRMDHFYVYKGMLERVADEEQRAKILAAAAPGFLQMEDAPEELREMAKGEARRLLEMAISHWDNKRLSEAEHALRKAMGMTTETGPFLALLAPVLALQQKREEAEAVLSQMHEQEAPEVAQAAASGLVWMALEQGEKARDAFETVTRLQPENANAWYLLGMVSLNRNDPAAAEDALSKACSVDENHADWWEALAAVCISRGKLADAEQPARRAVTLDADRRWAWGMLAISLGARGELTHEVEHAIQAGLGTDNTHLFPVLFVVLVGSALDAAAFNSLAERYRQFQKGRTFFLAALACAGAAQGLEEELPSAETWAREAVAEDPMAPHYQLTLAFVLASHAKWPEFFQAASVFLRDEDFVEWLVAFMTPLFTVAAAHGQAPQALAVLSASPAAPKLEPLITALQLATGQQPNAPAEVLEVAKDILKQIEAIREANAPPTKAHAKKPASSPKKPTAAKGRKAKSP